MSVVDAGIVVVVVDVLVLECVLVLEELWGFTLVEVRRGAVVEGTGRLSTPGSVG